MYVYEKYDYAMFESRFKDYNRQDQFSSKGLKTLFAYLEDMADELGEPIEVDVIGLCLEFAEIRLSAIKREIGCEDVFELKDKTTVLHVDDDTIIYGVY